MATVDGTERDARRGGAVRALTAPGLTNLFLGLERLSGGLITALMALFVLTVLLTAIAACGLFGAGLLLLPNALRLLRAVAERERRRLTRWGEDIVSPYAAEVPAGRRKALRYAAEEPAVRRDFGWLVCHASIGLLLGLLGVLLPVIAVRDTTFPLWWRLLPPDVAGASVGLPVHDWYAALAVGLMGMGWSAILFGLGPSLARMQSWPARTLLGPRSRTVMAERIAELTTVRAAALQAHTAELRRIERSLHDGAQSRLVGAAIRIGAARRALASDPARADASLEQAQTAAEEALAELRSLARGILPPVLEDRGLGEALSALAAGCSVPCTIDTGELGRCASSVEATAYFFVAEALTNVTRHSSAGHAGVRISREGNTLRIRVHDDGRGGADETHGTGLVGIRSRVEAHDGALALASPPGGPTVIEAELPC